MANIETLLSGYKRFRTRNYSASKNTYSQLAENGQFPKSMIISCADSRVDPAIIFDIEPGKIFTVRNVANLVPPYQPATASLHGVSAALEFAVTHVGVSYIIVMGHTHCAGVRALLENSTKDNSEFIHEWVSIAKPARDATLQAGPFDDEQHALDHCSHEAIKLSLANLQSFPFVQAGLKDGSLELHGWHFRLDTGQLDRLHSETGQFEKYSD